VRKSLRNTERFRQMTAQHAFAQQIPHAAYLPQAPFAFEYQTEFDLAVERVLRGRASAEAALSAAAAKIEAVMKRYATPHEAVAAASEAAR
jgi:maltose-binding protein MalE